MISAQVVLGAAKERGFDFFAGVPCSYLTPLINGVIGGGPTDHARLADALDRARKTMVTSSLPYALVLHKGTIADESLNEPAIQPRAAGRHLEMRRGSSRPSRFAALERFLATAPDAAAVIATTGVCGRELFTLADRPKHLY